MTPVMKLTAVDGEFVPQATVASCLRRYGLDAQGMVRRVLSHMGTAVRYK